MAPAVEKGTTLPAQKGGPAVSKWIARVTVATPAPLEEQHLVTLDEATERWDATIANRVPAIEHFARIWERRPGRPAARVG